MTLLRLMEYTGLIDRNQIRKDFNKTSRLWNIPTAKLLPPGDNTNMKHWQLYKEVLDILNEAINDNPVKRPHSLNMQQRLQQVLISASCTEEYASACYNPPQPTPVSEINPLLTSLIAGSKNNGTEP